jgi:phage shock protein A
MGILSRISSIIESNMNNLLDKSEDPEKMLEQCLREMQEHLREAKVAVARAIRDKKLIEQKVGEQVAQTEEWKKKASLALQKGDEGLAREALKRKKYYEEVAASFKAQFDTQAANVDMLKSSLCALEDKIEQARRKKDLLIARQKKAEADVKIHEHIAKITENTSAFETFDRLEQKIKEKEAEAEAVKEMSGIDTKIEQKFNDLQEDLDVEKDLDALKKELGK